MSWYRIETPGILPGPYNPAVVVFRRAWKSAVSPKRAAMFQSKRNTGGAMYFIYWPGDAILPFTQELGGEACDPPEVSEVTVIAGSRRGVWL